MGHWLKPLILILAGTGLWACQSGEDAAETNAAAPEAAAPPAAESAAPAPAPAAAVDPGEIKSAAEYLAEERFASADQTLGRRVFLQCRACHSLEAGGAHRVGPNLHGMFGLQAATKEGFNYSPALRDSGVIWTPAALEEWLIRPSSFVPGNKMAFAGIKREPDRTALLAYLLKETSAGAAE